MLKGPLIIVIILIQTIVGLAQVKEKDLNYYLLEAKSSSPVLKDFDNQRRSVHIDSLLTNATARIQITATSSGMYAPRIKGYGYDEVITNGQSLDALINVNYDLLNRKRITNQLEGVKIQSDSIKFADQLSLYDLNRSIIDQYVTAFASQEQVDFNTQVVVLLQKEDVLLKALTRSNIYKQAEYLTFLVTLQQQQLTLKQAELQYLNDYGTLNYLAGIVDTMPVRLAEPVLQKPLSHQRSFFFTRRFDLDSLKITNLRRGIDLNYKPRLGVYSNGGYNSSLIMQPYKNFGASVGFTFSIPIYNGQQRKLQYNKLLISASTISAYRDFFNQQQLQQINLISQQITQTDSLFYKINEQIRFCKSLIDVDVKLLHTGDLQISDFVIAINNYLSAQSLLRQTKINRLRLVNQFNYWNR
jgi:hypothetical protein